MTRNAANFPKWIMTVLFAILVVAMSWGPVQAQIAPTTTATVVADGSTTAAQAIAVGQSREVSNQALKAGLIILLFVVIATLIATRKLPAMVALPIMAIGIGICIGMPILGSNSIFSFTVEGLSTKDTREGAAGAFRLYEAIIYVLFGGMFARFIADAKIADRIVKFTAEFGGEDPYLICLLMAVVNVVIFTAGGGLPVIIMIGTVMFPILLSLGVSPVVCGCLLLLSFPIGTYLGPAFWGSQAKLFDVTLNQSIDFNIAFAAIMGVVLVGFLTYEFLSMKRGPVSKRSVLISLSGIVVLLGFVLGAMALDRYLLEIYAGAYGGIRAWMLFGIRSLLWGILAIAVIHSTFCKLAKVEQTIHWNLLTPILPLLFLLILGFSWTIINAKGEPQTISLIVPAFLCAIAFGVITTPGERMVQRLARTIMDGIGDVAAPVILMLGIGMLIAAANHPDAKAVIEPMAKVVVPTTALGFVVFFFFASPFSLYRGPLNQYGLGAAVAQVMKDLLPAGAPMGAIVSVGMLQDPTNSQYVWTSGYLKLSMNAMLFKLFFYSLIMMVCGLLLTVHLFYPNGLMGLFSMQVVMK